LCQIIRSRSAHPRQLAYPLDAETAQHREHIIIKPQCRHRQIAKQAERIIAGRKDRRRRSIAGQRPGRPGSGRERGAHAEPACVQGAGDIGEQALLTAPQMRRSGDIDQHAIGRIKRAPRPPALRPQRELLQRGKIARRIGWHRSKFRAERARIGEQHSGPRACDQPGIIGCGNARAMRGLDDERGRGGLGGSLSVRRERAPPAIDRQSGEPDG
jgi:hypothetical protein